jgi:hypothetical protein
VAVGEADSCPPGEILSRTSARVFQASGERPWGGRCLIAINDTRGRDYWTIEITSKAHRPVLASRLVHVGSFAAERRPPHRSKHRQRLDEHQSNGMDWRQPPMLRAPSTRFVLFTAGEFGAGRIPHARHLSA